MQDGSNPKDAFAGGPVLRFRRFEFSLESLSGLPEAGTPELENLRNSAGTARNSFNSMSVEFSRKTGFYRMLRNPG
jgi:hypothetical protein